MSDTGDLQFDRAEFEGDRPHASCAMCHESLLGSYYEINGSTVCEACCERIRTSLTSGTPGRRALRAIGAGVGAAIAGSLLYYAILAITGYEFGLIAIVVGFAVGKAVSWGSDGRGGWAYQTLAIALTYLAIVSAYLPGIITAIKDMPDETAQSETVAGEMTTAGASNGSAAEPASEPAAENRPPTFGQFTVAVLLLLAIACVAPFLAGLQNIMGLVIIGIGLYEAWKLNKRQAMVITGPHALARGVPAAT
jgi:hypothetical protein